MNNNKLNNYNIRIHKKDNTTILESIPTYLYEYMGYKFLIHKTWLSIKNNEKNPAWQVSEFDTGMGFISFCDTKKECYEKIHNWFNVDNIGSRIEFFDQAVKSQISKYGKAN